MSVIIDLERVCNDCKHVYITMQNDRSYLACRLASEEIENHLAALMRQGACGAEGKLWEAK